MSAKPEVDHRFLADSDLFVGLSDEQTERLAHLARRRDVAAGDVVVTEGSMGDSLFLLLSGELAVSTRDSRQKDVLLATLRDRGAFFGEMSIVDPAPRSAWVRAVAPSVVLEIDAAQLESFFDSFPEARVLVYRNIARVLARRLRQANTRVASGVMV